MPDKLPEVLGGCIGIIYTLTYRGILIAAALKYLSQ
jgi:hypothetical protein